MKVVERIFEHRIWQQIDIGDMQFGFMKGKGTTDAIFVVRQMQEKSGAKGKKRYFFFVDLQKAFDRVPREVIRWAMCKLGVEEWLVSAVMSMYTGAKTVLRTVYGNGNDFWPTVLSVEPLVHCVICLSVCRRLSVTFCIVAKRYVLANKKA